MQETYKLPHRLIEKKRRDRINECIAQLKDLLPEHLKLTVSSRRRWRDNGGGIWICDQRHAPSSGCSVVLHHCAPECVSKSVNEKLEEGGGSLLSASD